MAKMVTLSGFFYVNRRRDKVLRENPVALVIDGVTEAQLDLLAKKQGVSPLDLAKRLIADASAEESDPILQWLDATEQNWETLDPAEVAKREAEGEAFMRELAAGRELTHGPDARKL